MLLEVGWEQIVRVMVLTVGLLVVLMGSVHWLAWLFGLGRFRKDDASGGWLLRDFLATISADYRHILASAVVLLGLAIMLVVAFSDPIHKNAQIVFNTLPGLMGVVLGYYFGSQKAETESSTERIDWTEHPGSDLVSPPHETQDSSEGSSELEDANATARDDE